MIGQIPGQSGYLYIRTIRSSFDGSIKLTNVSKLVGPLIDSVLLSRRK
jgi:hypothetical protein